MPSVIIVDSDDRTRASLVGLVGLRGRVRVVGDAGRPQESLALVRVHRPDVVVLDPRLPELDAGVAVIRSIRSFAPEIGILVMGPTGALEHAALEAGADGFVRKTFRPDELGDAVVRCATRIGDAASRAGSDRPLR